MLKIYNSKTICPDLHHIPTETATTNTTNAAQLPMMTGLSIMKKIANIKTHASMLMPEINISNCMHKFKLSVVYSLYNDLQS